MTVTRTRQTAAREDARETPVSTEAASHGRTRVRQGTDKYHVDKDMIPAGWVYQWKRHTILGQEDPAYQAELAQVGFTPVPAERHPGRFLPAGSTGAIIIGGQILMERPIELEREARQEDKQRADAQVYGSKEQFGLVPRAPGFSTETQRARAATFARSQYETVDAPAPKYDLAVD